MRCQRLRGDRGWRTGQADRGKDRQRRGMDGCHRGLLPVLRARRGLEGFVEHALMIPKEQRDGMACTLDQSHGLKQEALEVCRKRAGWVRLRMGRAPALLRIRNPARSHEPSYSSVKPSLSV